MQPLYAIQIGLGRQEHSIKVYDDRVVIQKPEDEYISPMEYIRPDLKDFALRAVRKELQMQGIQFSGKLASLNAKYIGIDVPFDQIESVDLRFSDSEIMMNGLIVINLKGREKERVTFLNYAKIANAIKFRSDDNETARQIKQYIDMKIGNAPNSGLHDVFCCDGCGCQKMRFFYQGDAIVSRSIGDAARGSIILSTSGRPGIFRIKFTDTSGNIIESCGFNLNPDDVNAGKKKIEYTEFIYEGEKHSCLVCFNTDDHILKQYIFPSQEKLKICAEYIGISQITTRDIKTSEVIGTRAL
ncbi:MAG: hypothetical protein IJP48_06255 [Synergistaceae bacterium]|nr:hypothetical protein [Synergistaceae bacterium]